MRVITSPTFASVVPLVLFEEILTVVSDGAVLSNMTTPSLSFETEVTRVPSFPAKSVKSNVKGISPSESVFVMV